MFILTIYVQLQVEISENLAAFIYASTKNNPKFDEIIKHTSVCFFKSLRAEILIGLTFEIFENLEQAQKSNKLYNFFI